MSKSFPALDHILNSEYLCVCHKSGKQVHECTLSSHSDPRKKVAIGNTPRTVAQISHIYMTPPASLLLMIVQTLILIHLLLSLNGHMPCSVGVGLALGLVLQGLYSATNCAYIMSWYMWFTTVMVPRVIGLCTGTCYFHWHSPRVWKGTGSITHRGCRIIRWLSYYAPSSGTALHTSVSEFFLAPDAAFFMVSCAAWYVIPNCFVRFVTFSNWQLVQDS